MSDRTTSTNPADDARDEALSWLAGQFRWESLLADLQALEPLLPVPGPAPVPWAGTFTERRQHDPQLEAAWAAIAP